MPIAKAFIPDPPLETALDGPDASHTNLPAAAEVWEAARRAFVGEGLRSGEIACRFGLNPRTVRHHALTEGWREARARHRAAERLHAEALALDDPAEAICDEQREALRTELLLQPSTDTFLTALGRRMSEAMADGDLRRVGECQSLIERVTRSAAAIDRALHGGADANTRARLAAYRRLMMEEDAGGG